MTENIFKFYEDKNPNDEKIIDAQKHEWPWDWLWDTDSLDWHLDDFSSFATSLSNDPLIKNEDFLKKMSDDERADFISKVQDSVSKVLVSTLSESTTSAPKED